MLARPLARCRLICPLCRSPFVRLIFLLITLALNDGPTVYVGIAEPEGHSPRGNATEKNTKATQKPYREVEQWYARPLRL